MSRKLTVIILTFNSEASLAEVVKSTTQIASRVLVVDSFSSDQTVGLARSLGCDVVQHAFENYSRQRNWAQQYARMDPCEWVLHLDSDEVVSPELARSIREALMPRNISNNGFLMRRLSFFLGHPIKYGHTNPSWHLRLFMASKGCCEDRLYDQHFVVPGPCSKLAGLLLDRQAVSIEQWTASHNRWSGAEAREAVGPVESDEPVNGKTLPASLSGDARMKKRWMKNQLYYKCPLLLRTMVFFFYSYILRLGFLDGKTGLIYHVLQAFWFRFLVDSKIVEAQMKQRAGDTCEALFENPKMKPTKITKS